MTINKKQLLKEMGERLSAVRKSLYWSQQEAAEQCNLSQQTISKAETGEAGLLPDSMLKVCLAYNISADYLLTGDVGERDIAILDKRLRELDSDDFIHYKGITDHFLAVALKK